jgi:transposase, IS5 family
MRKRFEQQLTICQIPIEETFISPKSKNALDELLAALKGIYLNTEYNEKIFSILETYLCKKKKTGRPGMDLWCIFVLAQVRLCLNESYNMLHNLANNHRSMRQLMGIERSFGHQPVLIEYQNIYDNVSMLSDEMIKEINEVILDFGHKEVFKKKEETALRLKTDSFVVESNVHFPTDYNLLWDCVRKSLDTIAKFLKKYNGIKGWRKIKDWRYEIKGLMRELGKMSSSGGKNKEERLKISAKNYLKKANVLLEKLNKSIPGMPINDQSDVFLIISLEYFMMLMEKHIDLIDRRILKGEKIPHEEKLFSIFEQYTEWIQKGKLHPNVELGKNLAITTDQYNLIVDYMIMENVHDRDIVIELKNRLLAKYNIESWSFDKGFWRKENKASLQLNIPKVIMQKLGKRNKEEENEEKSTIFRKNKNKHSAIESNINELEHRGLNRCPDRGEEHFNRYIGIAVSAYNLKKIGREILRQQKIKMEKTKNNQKGFRMVA